MLRELCKTRQIPGSLPRRWFSSPDMDLILWYDNDGIAGFQLCYDKDGREKAATLKPHSQGLHHSGVSDGEVPGFRHKQSPVLSSRIQPDLSRLIELFQQQARNLSADIRQFVSTTLAGAAD